MSEITDETGFKTDTQFDIVVIDTRMSAVITHECQS